MADSISREQLNIELNKLDKYELLGVVWGCAGWLTGLKDREYSYQVVHSMLPQKEPQL